MSERDKVKVSVLSELRLLGDSIDYSTYFTCCVCAWLRFSSDENVACTFRKRFGCKSRRLSLQICTKMKSVWMNLLLLGLPVALSFGFGNSRELKLINEWRSIDFNFPSEALRQDAIQRGQFVVGMPIPIDIDVHYKGRGQSTSTR